MNGKMNCELDIERVTRLMLLDALHAAMLQWEIDKFVNFDPVSAYSYVVMTMFDDQLCGLIDDMHDGDDEAFYELLEHVEYLMNELLPIR